MAASHVNRRRRAKRAKDEADKKDTKRRDKDMVAPWIKAAPAAKKTATEAPVILTPVQKVEPIIEAVVEEKVIAAPKKAAAKKVTPKKVTPKKAVPRKTADTTTSNKVKAAPSRKVSTSKGA